MIPIQHDNLLHMKHRLAHLDRLILLWENTGTALSEKNRRLWAAKQAKEIGHGGAPLVAQATGLSISTIRRGLKELKNPSDLSTSRSRKPGAGRKNITQKLPNIHQAISSLMKPDYQNQPLSPFLWTVHDTTLLCRRLKLAGFPVSDTKLTDLLQEFAYEPHYQHRRGRHPASKNRDGQCRRIGMMAQKCADTQQPLVFVSIKEHPHDNDLLQQAPLHACLMPCTDMLHSKGWITNSINHANTSFVLQALHTWWRDIGMGIYPSASNLSLVMHGAIEKTDENIKNEAAWQEALQHMANTSKINMRVRHLPPSTFRWNAILHKTTTYSLSEDKIVAVTLCAIGVSGKETIVSSFWDVRPIPAIPRVDKIHIKNDKFHPEWNYTITSKFKSLSSVIGSTSI